MSKKADLKLRQILMQFVKSKETILCEAPGEAGGGSWLPHALKVGTKTQGEGTAVEINTWCTYSRSLDSLSMICTDIH